MSSLSQRGREQQGSQSIASDFDGQKKTPTVNVGVLMEEAVGFEPTVAINYDSFQDCSVRPLRHASVPLSLEEIR